MSHVGKRVQTGDSDGVYMYLISKEQGLQHADHTGNYNTGTLRLVAL